MTTCAVSLISCVCFYSNALKFRYGRSRKGVVSYGKAHHNQNHHEHIRMAITLIRTFCFFNSIVDFLVRLVVSLIRARLLTWGFITIHYLVIDFFLSFRQNEATCAKLKTDPDKGLSNDEVIKRREKYGKNELEAAPPKSLMALVLEQFEDMLVIILLAAAALSFVLACFEESKEGEVCCNYFLLSYVGIGN